MRTHPFIPPLAAALPLALACGGLEPTPEIYLEELEHQIASLDDARSAHADAVFRAAAMPEILAAESGFPDHLSAAADEIDLLVEEMERCGMHERGVPLSALQAHVRDLRDTLADHDHAMHQACLAEVARDAERDFQRHMDALVLDLGAWHEDMMEASHGHGCYGARVSTSP